MKKFVLIIASLLWLCSCELATTFEYDFDSFVTAYYEYANIEVVVNNGPEVLVCPKIGEIYSEQSSDPQIKARFDELANSYNDLNYNKKHVGAQPFHYPNLMAIENIAKIDIICIEDIDESHKAGEPVADLFTFNTVSPLRFIQSGYTYLLDENSSNHSNGYFKLYYEPILKPLDETTSSDLYMIGNGEYINNMLFYLTPKDVNNCPALGKKLRLTLNYDNQHPISKDFVFEKGEY